MILVINPFKLVCFVIFSRTFRDDLEKIVDQQLREGGAAGLFALQQHISDLTGMGTHTIIPYFISDRKQYNKKNGFLICTLI